MTIKEVESLTGMPRASIRFYEAEGLFQPQREKNGYRIYTQEHVDELLRIRLLRLLEVSVEEIRELAAARLTLPDCLRRHLAQLEETQVRSARSTEICRQLVETAADFRDLDAAQWLSLLENERPPAAPEQVTLPKPGIWRRLLARSVDGALCILLWELVLTSLFRVKLTGGGIKDLAQLMQLLESVAVMACIMLFEPLFLRWWGTTPGKWIMGISVTDDKGKRLTYRDALSRCGMLLLYGYGLGIPVLTLIRQVKSLLDIRRGEEPEWEWDSCLQLQRKSRIRAAVLYVLSTVLLLVSQSGIRALPEIPPNRGELTVKEFSQNFIALQRYYESGGKVYIVTDDMRDLTLSLPYTLDGAGRWTASGYWAEAQGDFHEWKYSGDAPELTLHTDADGTVTGATLSLRAEWIAGAKTETARQGRRIDRQIFVMRVVAQAFGGAQPEMLMPFSGWRTVQELVANGWRQDYSFVHRGIAVDYDVEFSGCAPAENGAPDLEETAEHCSVTYTFTIQRTD